MSVFYVPAGVENIIVGSNTIYSTNDNTPIRQSTFSGFNRIWNTGKHKIKFNKQPYGQRVDIDPSYTMACSFGPAMMVNEGFRMCLMNPSVRTTTINSFKDAGIITIIDSGGFQFLSGVKDFVDPDFNIKYYNKLGNIGMDLDIPSSHVPMRKEHRIALALIQKESYKYMKERVKPSVKLCLVNHGYTIDDRQLCYDTLDRPESEVEFLALPGFARSDRRTDNPYELRIAEAILHSVKNYPKVKYIHCLGLSSNLGILIYSLVDQLDIVKNIGGDSVSHIMTGASGTFNIKPFGHLSLDKKYHTHVYPNCGCPICQVMADYSLLNGFFPIAIHNLINSKRNADYIQLLVKEFLANNIKDHELIRACNVKITAEQFRVLYDYITEFKSSGVFKPLKIKHKNGLFGTKTIPTEPYANYFKVISNYEAYYKKRFM